MVGEKRIAILLPYAENFSPLKAGALSLFTYEMTLRSRYKDSITVYGKNGIIPYEKLAYKGLKPHGRLFNGRNIGLAEALYRSVRDNPPDMIEIHNRPVMFLHLKEKMPQTKMALHFHNDPQSMRGAKTTSDRRSLLQKADIIYCVSDFIRNRFLEGVICSDKEKDKIKIVYNGIRRLSVTRPEKEEIILYAGRLVEEKGVEELLQAVVQVFPKFPNWKFVVVGAKRHGEYHKSASPFERRLYRLFDMLGNQGEFLGHRPYDQVLRLYQKASIVVVPSKWDEPLGRTAIEALAEGCALVSSDRGGLKEINNGCGSILKDVTLEEIAGHLTQLMSDKMKLDKVQEQCWKAYDSFAIDTVAKGFDAYRDTVC